MLWMALSVMLTALAWQGSAAQGKTTLESKASNKVGLLSAVQSCDLPTLNAFIASGVNLSGSEFSPAALNDALSLASQNRVTTLRSDDHIRWTLKCPPAVVALTQAGADPWKAAFYQNPRLDHARPKMIAIIRVDDVRQVKQNSGEIVEEMTDGVETQLHGGNRINLKYPIIGLNQARQKLRTSGFSAEDTMAPDRTKACNALGVDSVLEASMVDFGSKSIGIASAAAMRMRFILTDCNTGELLWGSDRYYSLQTGWLIRGSRIKRIITGFADAPALAFPAYEKRNE